MAESIGIEPMSPFDGRCFPSKHIAALSTFLNLAEDVGIEPTSPFDGLCFQDRRIATLPIFRGWGEQREFEPASPHHGRHGFIDRHAHCHSVMFP